MDAGLDIGNDDIEFDVNSLSFREMVFETIIHSEDTERIVKVSPHNATDQDLILDQLVSSSYFMYLKNQPNSLYSYDHIEPTITIEKEKFLVVDENLNPVIQEELRGSFGSQLVVEDKLECYLTSSPMDSRNLNIVSEFELDAMEI
ncbi:MAG: hypothetical protein ACXAC7_24410 [Candidatus Hodarchaeales archaeon]|jgi:hypothetical protein